MGIWKWSLTKPMANITMEKLKKTWSWKDDLACSTTQIDP